MCFEGMEENGSDNLDKFIESEKDKFFAGADCMCISGELRFVFHFVTRWEPRAEFRQLLAR